MSTLYMSADSQFITLQNVKFQTRAKTFLKSLKMPINFPVHNLNFIIT